MGSVVWHQGCHLKSGFTLHRKGLQPGYVGATVRNDLFVHELRHRVSFATGLLLRLPRSAESQPTVLINLCRISATGAWYTRSCTTLQMRQSTGLRSGLGHMSACNEFGSFTMKQLHRLTCTTNWLCKLHRRCFRWLAVHLDSRHCRLVHRFSQKHIYRSQKTFLLFIGWTSGSMGML